MDFFLAGLLEVGELLWHLYSLFTWVPCSVISICSLSIWSAFSDEEELSLLTGNPSTDDNFAAIFCAPWNAHRQISWTFHIQILYIKIYITHSAKIIYTVYTIYRRQSFHRSYRNTAHEIRHPSIWQHYVLFNHHCPTCRHVKLRKQTDPTKNRFGKLSCFKIAWKWGS